MGLEPRCVTAAVLPRACCAPALWQPLHDLQLLDTKHSRRLLPKHGACVCLGKTLPDSLFTEVAMSRLKALAGVTATAVIALVGWSCEANRTALAPPAGGPLFHFQQFECTPLKMTGGGRIDYPPGTRDKNPPASHEYETFGAHVIAS